MPFLFTNWRTVSADGLVVRGPVLLYSIHFHGRDVGDYGTVYEGMDPTSGQKLCVLYGGTDVVNRYVWATPIFMERGIYLDANSDLEGATFAYRTIDSSPFELERKD